jgi:hypothetical protein
MKIGSGGCGNRSSSLKAGWRENNRKHENMKKMKMAKKKRRKPYEMALGSSRRLKYRRRKAAVSAAA